ncbi:transaldolase [Nitrosophilus alvini]|uniref:transaldolase n=1 Tax=Nitrosophilus alvini TaxID=2714855 RepID=UPI00190D93A0|nr:transaldolase [Nitrosophilus alvini]
MYLKDIKFSLWADFIERDFLDNKFEELIEKNIINGATSNPAIFKNAILTSRAYKKQIESLSGKKPKEIYEAVAIYDIQKAADKLAGLYERKDDGFVSLEVDPFLCDDAKATVEEAKRLYDEIDRPNVMIKVPVTKAGCEAIEELISEGININATLIFSKNQAKECLDAIERGLRRCEKETPSSVLSIFVSRFDRKLDPVLKEKGLEPGRVGIMNAANIYNDITDRALPDVRALFASTGVKDKSYPPEYYISELLAPMSINTAPVETIEYFLDSGKKEAKLPIEREKIEEFFENLKRNGIDVEKVSQELMDEGLEAFKVAFKEILAELE